MFKNFLLALKTTWRDWRAGEWYIIFLALLIAVSSTTALHFYTNRLSQAFNQQAARILGGDLVISSPIPIPREWVAQARTLKLRTAEIWSYSSMVSAGKQLQLIDIEAVSASYPLISNNALRPEPNTIWVEPRLLSLINASLGTNVNIGAANFKIAKTFTPEVALSGFAIAPRVLIRIEDLAATKTVLPGSRIDYRLLLSGNATQLNLFRSFVSPKLKPGQRLLDVQHQQFVMNNILERTKYYLQLALLIVILMCGVAIGLSTRQYLKHHYSQVALWRCFGAKRSQIMSIMLWQLIFLSLIAGTVGVIAGYFFHLLIAKMLVSFFPLILPSSTVTPVFLGFFTGSILLFMFAFPTVEALPATSPLILWQEKTLNTPGKKFYYLLFFVLAIIFLYVFLDFSLLTLFIIDIILISGGLLYAICVLILKLIRKVSPYTTGIWKRSLSQLIYSPEDTGIQFVAFTLVVMLIAILGFVRTAIVYDWQQSLPEHAPNYFAINIAPQDVYALQQKLYHHDVHIEGVYPMVRGRLIALNNQPIMKAVPSQALDNNALHRELNLSYMWKLPKNNEIVEGAAWTKKEANQALISVEVKLAQDLGLKLGDQLTFQIGERRLSAKIINFRSVKWSSFQPNFYVIFAPGALNTFASTYITSFYLHSVDKEVLNELTTQFPNITIIDVANLLKQIQILLDIIINVVQYLFLFAFGIAILIFITALQASLDERKQMHSLLRTLGATRLFLNQSSIIEWLFLACIILICGIGFAKLISIFLIKQFFIF